MVVEIFYDQLYIIGIEQDVDFGFIDLVMVVIVQVDFFGDLFGCSWYQLYQVGGVDV